MLLAIKAAEAKAANLRRTREQIQASMDTLSGQAVELRAEEEAAADHFQLQGRLMDLCVLQRYCDLAESLVRFQAEVAAPSALYDGVEAGASLSLEERAANGLLAKVEHCFRFHSQKERNGQIDGRVDGAVDYVEKSIRVATGLR